MGASKSTKKQPPPAANYYQWPKTQKNKSPYKIQDDRSPYRIQDDRSPYRVQPPYNIPYVPTHNMNHLEKGVPASEYPVAVPASEYPVAVVPEDSSDSQPATSTYPISIRDQDYTAQSREAQLKALNDQIAEIERAERVTGTRRLSNRIQYSTVQYYTVQYSTVLSVPTAEMRSAGELTGESRT